MAWKYDVRSTSDLTSLMWISAYHGVIAAEWAGQSVVSSGYLDPAAETISHLKGGAAIRCGYTYL